MTKIKICGLRRDEDIDAANRCRPDYIGFVFAESKRRVTPQEALRLRGRLDAGIAVVGVFVDEAPETVAALCGQGVIDIAQLHGGEDARYIAALRGLAAGPLIKSIPVGGSAPADFPGADYLLFDTASAVRGGSGKRFDWALLEGFRARPYLLAGGLDCANVAQAVRALRPYGVDVSSGVETGGCKDADKMLRFVGAVRQADSE